MNALSLKRKMGLVAVAALASIDAFALAPLFQAYSNGSMMYAFEADSSRTGVSVQVKGSDDADWCTVTGIYGTWGNMRTWTCKTNFPGRLSVRIAAVTADGVGQYDEAPPLSATRALPGEVISSGSAEGAFDGYFSHTDAVWAGLDLGSIQKITKLRYNFRFEYGIFGYEARWNGTKFQIADDSTFLNPRDVHVVNRNNYVGSTMNEVTFDPPLEARYIRHIASQYSSLNEFEVIGEDGGAVPVAFARFDVDNTNNVCRWSTSDFESSASNRLERSRFPEGPWTDVSGWRRPGDTFCLTDHTAAVGIEYWYRVRSDSASGDAETSIAVPHRRLRCLDRDIADLTKLRPGVTVYQSNVGTAFDGDWSTFADVQPDNAPVGCIFDDTCYLAAAWFLGRPNLSIRVNGAVLYGSNDIESPMSDPDRLSCGFVCDAQLMGYAQTFFPARQGYRVLYASKSGWYGNLCEINFFGWSESDIAAAGLPRYPTVLSAENGDEAGVVSLTWSGGFNVDTYDVQYRLKGDVDWLTFADALPSETEACSVTGLANGTNYEFRVVGHGAGESGSSPTATCYVYQLEPGYGTGLKAVVYGAANVTHVAVPPTVEKSVWGTAEIDQDGGSLFTNAEHSTALVMLHGKLIVPLTGQYTFTFEAKGTDGYAFRLDDTERLNIGTSAGIRRYVVGLNAGEHPIAIVYRSNNSRKYLHVGWALEGVWAERAIPQSQLVPMEEADYTDCTPEDSDGWQLSIPSSATTATLPWFRWHGDGSFYLHGDTSDYTWNNLTLLTRLERGPFDLSFTLNSSELAGRACIFVTDKDGKSANAISLIYTGGSFGMKGGPGQADLISPAWPGALAGTTKFRLVRASDKTLTFYVKNNTYGNLADDAEWHEFKMLPNGLWTEKGIDLSGRDLRIGVNVFYGGSYATVRDFKLDSKKTGTVIMLR